MGKLPQEPVVVITGCSSGIGREAALMFAERQLVGQRRWAPLNIRSGRSCLPPAQLGKAGQPIISAGGTMTVDNLLSTSDEGRVTVALFAPESPVILTARELAAAHSSQPEGTCPRCGSDNPCPVATHALQVCAAAGVSAEKEPAAKAEASAPTAARARKGGGTAKKTNHRGTSQPGRAKAAQPLG